MKLFDFLLKKTKKEKNTYNTNKNTINKRIMVAKYYDDLIYILDGELYCNGTIITVEEARRKEIDYMGYQAYMDYAKGSATPEEAYFSHGFIKQGNMWVLKKHNIDNFLHLIKAPESDI